MNKKDIPNYVLGVLQMPIEGRRHIEAMVILHFDIPDAEAKVLVGKALVKALEIYQHHEKIKENELRQIRDMIDKLREMIPETETS